MPKERQDITEIIQAFANHIGLEPKPVVQQRRYCKHLIDQLGSKTMDVVRYAISIQSSPYAPRITSPKDLYYKLSRVMDYYRKSNQDNGRVVSV